MVGLSTVPSSISRKTEQRLPKTEFSPKSLSLNFKMISFVLAGVIAIISPSSSWNLPLILPANPETSFLLNTY